MSVCMMVLACGSNTWHLRVMPFSSRCQSGRPGINTLDYLKKGLLLSALGDGLPRRLDLPVPEGERECVYHLHSVICIRDRTAVVIHTTNLPRVGKGIRLSPPVAKLRDPCQGQTSGLVLPSVTIARVKPRASLLFPLIHLR